jgi:hypothetical protein
MSKYAKNTQIPPISTAKILKKLATATIAKIKT